MEREDKGGGVEREDEEEGKVEGKDCYRHGCLHGMIGITHYMSIVMNTSVV